MGSCCSSHQQEIEENKEMKDGLIPKFENTVEVDEKEEIKETEKENQNMKNMKSMKENKKEVKQSLYNFSQNYQQDSMDSDFITSEQKISEEIYDYFNDIRNNPQNYLSEGQKNGLQNVISTAAEKAVEGNIQNILKNPHLEMVFDNCVKANRDSKEEILRYFQEQLPHLPVTRDWLKEYYQLANRLATAALLNKHGVKTKVLYIYFVNGYRKRVVERPDGKEQIYETVNYNATEEQFKKAIEKEMSVLGINYDSTTSILCPSVFVNAEP